ncbi:MAG: cation:proton antiporter [Clostridia bacterium]|jgi:Kef-type K+ transport system membrane component KefB|nr:cation:proton antiporter [Clostridia bacterium]
MEILYGFKPVHDNSYTILLFTLILGSGFLMTRVTKVAKLPHVTGYLLAGILIGPSVLKLVDIQTVMQLDVVTDIALAIIAFSVGRFFKLSKLKSNGMKSVVLTLFESGSAMFLIMVSMHYLFDLPWTFCLMLGAIGSATSSASTMMTIRQYKAKGVFVDSILQVTALDDAFALVAFSVSAAVLQAAEIGHLTFSIVMIPVIKNIGAVALGFGSAYILKYLIAKRNSDDHRLVVLMIIIFGLAGVCSELSVSPLLSCMVLGATYRNITNDKQLFRLLNFFAPPILLTFFVVSGMKLDLHMLIVAGGMGIAYFFIRIVGKYLGAFAGASVCKMDKSIRNYLGLALFPQAGVSIGLAALGQRLLPPDMANLLTTIILSSAVLYEVAGPAAAKFAIVLSGSIPKDDQEEFQEQEQQD